MTFGQLYDLCVANEEPAPPGCFWEAWDIQPDAFIRPLVGFPRHGSEWHDKAVVRIQDLVLQSTDEQRVSYIRTVQEIACLCIVSGAADEDIRCKT